MRSLIALLFALGITLTARADDPTLILTLPYIVLPGQITIAGKTIQIPPVGTTTPPPVTDPPPPATGGCGRPTGNTGLGYYVACSRLNKPDGTEFRMRGVNRTHFEQRAASGIKLAKANTARSFYTYQWGWKVTNHVGDFNEMIGNAVLPVAANADHSTCKTDQASLDAAVNDWVNNAASYKPLNTGGVVNIANEWGPGNSTAWRDAYIAAIKKLRAAGYTMPLMIDSGQCGQDSNDILSYGAAVAASDPQKNIILSFHLYGLTPNEPQMKTYFQKFAALAKSNPNMAIVIGEFGPGFNIGPSPTMITPEQVVADAEASGLGWLAWAWDDNNLDGCRSNDSWFSMTTNCAQYTGDPNQLTRFGKTMLTLYK